MQRRYCQWVRLASVTATKYHTYGGNGKRNAYLLYWSKRPKSYLNLYLGPLCWSVDFTSSSRLPSAGVHVRTHMLCVVCGAVVRTHWDSINYNLSTYGRTVGSDNFAMRGISPYSHIVSHFYSLGDLIFCTAICCEVDLLYHYTESDRENLEIVLGDNLMWCTVLSNVFWNCHIALYCGCREWGCHLFNYSLRSFLPLMGATISALECDDGDIPIFDLIFMRCGHCDLCGWRLPKDRGFPWYACGRWRPGYIGTMTGYYYLIIFII